MIKLSVIVPVYKVPLDYLRECLDSLVVQTLQDSEFIIVSDGAGKAEISICEKYANHDSRFKIFKQEHAGVSTARNFGIEQAQGEYITFIDSDDWTDANTCEQIVSFADQAKCDVLIFALKEHYSNGKTRTLHPFPKDIKQLETQDINIVMKNIIHIFNHKFIPTLCTVCKAYNSSFLRKNSVKFCPDLPIGEDRVFNFLTYTKTNKIAYLDRPFYHYRIRKSSNRNSCNEQTLRHSFSYINKLKELSNGLYDNEIGLEAISEVWQFCSKVSRERKFIENIKQSIVSEMFQDFIYGIKKTTPHPLVKLDTFAFKRKWTFPIYIHLLCAWAKDKIHLKSF